MPAGPLCLCEEQGSMYWGREGRAVAPTGAGLSYGQFTNVQVDADAQVRKLEEELRFKKNIQLSTTLLASGLADKMGEQDCKWRP